jgi:hypothetical protein
MVQPDRPALLALDQKVILVYKATQDLKVAMGYKECADHPELMAMMVPQDLPVLRD